MNKVAIRNFAVNARKKLRTDIEQKAYQLGITKKEVKQPEIYEDGFRINGQFYKKYEINQRNELLAQIKVKGFEQVIEEIAYTWFNRFIALRFMEVNDYLPTGVRIFSSLIEGKKEPDAVTEVEMIADELNLNMDIVYRLQDANDAKHSEDLFKYILIKQCNKLGETMPVVFEKIEDYTELLLPDHLLVEGSVVRQMIEMIDEEDWKEEVEIIGWLYQYYISEKKDEVFANLRKRQKITKENIPAATQLFTPKWIVQYMVENSVGRLWLESQPNESLQANWSYYIEEAKQELEVEAELERLKQPNLKPEAITVFDPCVGSGHILVYAFDLLYEIYEANGYAKRDIPKLILENNLFGLDIDDRAAQLAYFALLMKACSYNRRMLEEPIDLHVYAIQESNQLTFEKVENVLNLSRFHGDKQIVKNVLEHLLDVFCDAKEYGTLLHVESIEYELVAEWLAQLKEEHFNDLFADHDKATLLEYLPPLIEQAKLMTRKYDVVITNPPYMGRGGMNPKLTNYLDNYYKDSKSDLFAVFMEVSTNLAKQAGFVSLINQQSWMFLSSYEKLRDKLLRQTLIQSMLHLGPRAFEEIGGEVVQSTAFVLRNLYMQHYKGTYIRLVDERTAEGKREKAEEIINKSFLEEKYIFNQNNFTLIPNKIIAYWISERVTDLFINEKPLTKLVNGVTKGIYTGDNNRFIKNWFEVYLNDIEEKKWNKYSKGGSFRKWYGNSMHVIKWENDAFELRNFKGSGMGAAKYYGLPHIVWSGISTSSISFRYDEDNVYFDDVSPAVLLKNEQILFFLALLNSKPVDEILKIIAPTMHYQIGDIRMVPVILLTNENSFIVNKLGKSSLELSKSDWDSFETSWDFKRHPLLNGERTLGEAFKKWELEAAERFATLKANEEELNRIFIEIYGLQEELTPDVDDKDVTVRKANLEREVKSFISYAVGCMLGRYSLDEDGLIYAGGEFDVSRYRTFLADVDNVIPITDEDYFDDDIVGRFIDFVRVTFSEDVLEDNLEFIAEALTKRANETARQRIRRYFLTEFYSDHVRMYQKCPIYWQFDSGRQNGFKALVYMHRYEPGLVARVRTEYLHLLQRKYESELARMDMILEADVAQSEKTKAKKQKEKLYKQLLECREYDQVIAHIANKKIPIDLDEGVKVNYAKFQDVELAQGDGRAPLKRDVLKKI